MHLFNKLIYKNGPKKSDGFKTIENKKMLKNFYLYRRTTWTKKKNIKIICWNKKEIFLYFDWPMLQKENVQPVFPRDNEWSADSYPKDSPLHVLEFWTFFCYSWTLKS